MAFLDIWLQNEYEINVFTDGDLKVIIKIFLMEIKKRLDSRGWGWMAFSVITYFHAFFTGVSYSNVQEA